MSNSQNIQELKQFTHQAFAKMEGQIDYLVAEFNRIKEEEFQSQLMVRGNYMIDEDESINTCHEHIPTTTILESEEIVDDNEVEEK
jgi:pimeloyl-CoA synthetase